MKTEDDNKAYLAGVLHGDAWCTKSSLGLRVKDFDFALAFYEALVDVCDVRPRLAPDERGYWTLRIRNTTGRFSHLRRFEPKLESEKSAWLRGFFDSDGSAQLTPVKGTTQSFSRRICIVKTNAETIAKAESILSDFGIPTVVRPTRIGVKGRLVLYRLIVRRKEGFERFSRLIGSSIQRKRETMDRILATYQPPGWQAVNWAKAIESRYGAASKRTPL